MTQDELKLALEALKFAYNHCDSDWVQDEKINPAITAIKEALAQTQEPVATLFGSLPVYDTTTPQRTWVRLTDEDISEIVRGTHNTGSFVRAIEAKLKELNT